MSGVNEKCGVAGVYLYDTTKSASRILYQLLLQLYHRGHEGGGIVSFDQKLGIKEYKGLGRLRDIFKEGMIAEELPGNVAIGHTRYGTVGKDIDPNLFLHPVESPNGEFFIAQNGTLAPYEFNELLKDFPSRNRFDTQLLAALLEKELLLNSNDWSSVLESATRRLDGSYTSTILTRDGKLIAFREPRGFKPLNYGEIDGGYAVASETSALETIGARTINPVQPGEMLIIDESGLRKIRFADAIPSLCSFELVYFSRVDSKIGDLSCALIRKRLGRLLAEKYPVEADCAGAIPEGGRVIADGYVEVSKIPYTEVFLINREVGRVFILPEKMRGEALRQKYQPIKDLIEGKRLVITEDSIVRGDTTGQLVRTLFDAGAKEVHVRIAFPPITHPCVHGGVAFASRDKLAMNRYGNVEGVRKHIGATSLAYCSPEDLLSVFGTENVCLACTTGRYPLKHPIEESTIKSLGLVE